VNFLDVEARLIRSSGVLRKIVGGGKAAVGTEESFRKAEEEMIRFTEEWNTREKRETQKG
jgi:hypothetical protein